MDSKDSYTIPSIDKLVNGSSTHQILSFLDAYLGYNQIRMSKDDEEKTPFINEYGRFCYSVMPFGLKNVGATYERMMDTIFKDQIGRNMEVYVDDMVVKSESMDAHAIDLKEVFRVLERHNMRLNPKCVFGVREGKFLGFMRTQMGIEANL